MQINPQPPLILQSGFARREENKKKRVEKRKKKTFLATCEQLRSRRKECTRKELAPHLMVEMVETRKCAVLFVRPAMRNLRHLASPIGGLASISTTLLLLGSEVLGGEKHPETSRTGVNTGKPAVSQPSSKIEITASRRRSGLTRLEASFGLTVWKVTALQLHDMAPRLTPFSLGWFGPWRRMRHPPSDLRETAPLLLASRETPGLAVETRR